MQLLASLASTYRHQRLTLRRLSSSSPHVAGCGVLYWTSQSRRGNVKE
jgi:hypothetical protein